MTAEREFIVNWIFCEVKEIYPRAQVGSWLPTTLGSHLPAGFPGF
jgi:hypothetical protein